jgi:hypothetical protein
MAEFSQEVKELAYSLDPHCWVRYSGKLKSFKQEMEVRRLASLSQASEAVGTARRIREHAVRVETLEPKSKLAIKMIDAVAAMMKAGTVTIEDVQMVSSLDDIKLTINLRRKCSE